MLATFSIRNNAPLHIPVDSCCNCGERAALQQAETKLRLMPYLGLAGAEIVIPVPLPYCDRCKVTARRNRPNVLGVIALITLLSVGGITAWFFGAGELVDEVPIETAAIAALVLSTTLVLAFYGLRRARSPQTSYYQPVRIMKLSHQWPADVTAMVLRFSNPSYAKAFEAANSKAVEEGRLEVSC